MTFRKPGYGPSPTGVTVVIPNWNHELLLPQSISSALDAVAVLRRQGYGAEVLVIDDASRDGSLSFLRQLEAYRFRDGLRVLALAANGGLAAARNHGFAHARYRFIIFLDADNGLVPENAPLLLETLLRTGAFAAYGNLLQCHIGADRAHGIISNESFQSRIYQRNYIDAFAMLDRDQALRLGGYSTAYKTLEDYEHWLHLAANGARIIFVPVVVGYYYILPNSMISDGSLSLQTEARIHRIYDQLRARQHYVSNTNHLRYHPAVGFC
jgi:glycosyltransferase involved in cell wall biosynthesis